MTTVVAFCDSKKRMTIDIDVQNPRNATEKRLLKLALDALSEKERSDFLAIEKENPFKINPDYQNLVRKLEKFKKSKNKNNLIYAQKKLSKSIENYKLLYGKNKAESFCEPKKDEKYLIRYGFVEKNLFELVKIGEILIECLKKIKN